MGSQPIYRTAALSRTHSERRCRKEAVRADHHHDELARDSRALPTAARRGEAAAAASPAGRKPQRSGSRQTSAADGERQAGGQSALHGAVRTESAARDLQRTPTRRSADRLLVQPLQRRRAQRAGAVPTHGVRARSDPAARPWQLPRFARGDRDEPGDALLSRQLDEPGSERSCPPPGARTASSLGAAADKGCQAGQREPAPARRSRVRNRRLDQTAGLVG